VVGVAFDIPIYHTGPTIFVSYRFDIDDAGLDAWNLELEAFKPTFHYID